jgi:hypothetical protein
MGKKWEELTPDEKVEDLRRDVVRLFTAVNGALDELRRVSGETSQAQNLASEVAKAVQALERQKSAKDG